MKLNGALKPRHGASRQGSSPGVVLRKYRDKRYNSQNENVVNGLPLNECGGLNKTLNTNYKNNNQQQQQHNPRQKKCGEISSSLCSSSYSNYNNSSNNNNNTQYRITATTTSAEGAGAENIDYNSHGSRKSAPTKTTTINHNNKDVVNLMPTQQQQPVNNNITTRQVNNNNNSNINNKENNNGEKKAKRTKSQQKEEEAVEIRIAGVAITTTPPSNISKYHVTPNKNNNNRNNANNTISYCKEVNKFLLIPKIYEKLISCALAFLTVIISWLFIQFKLLLFSMFSMSIEKPHSTGNPVGGRHSVGGAGGSDCGGVSFDIVGHNSNKIMRASQSFKESFERICFKNVFKSRLPPSFALCLAAAILLPLAVVADDGDNFYPINGLETTTPEFDYASRGQKKFGDKCENTLECGFPGSICDPKKKSCQCTEDLPVTNHFDKCGKEAAVNESCFFNEQCEVKYFQTECRDQRCVCRFDMSPIWLKDGTVECKGRGEKKVERYIDPAMIGVLIGMALMFIIICVVLRLFSQARWHENRTIFNTPNPRLMNVSLLRESKLLHGQERRGSRMSVRAPSRQPSMASLRPHSPNPSLGKTGRMTRSKSNTRSSDSRVSDASNCSRLLEHHTATNTHHASHMHANATHTHANHSHGPHSASVSPLSINSPPPSQPPHSPTPPNTTTITYVNQAPVAGNVASTNLPTTPPPTVIIKPNKF